MLDETTPSRITPSIEAFCRSLDPSTQPGYVPVRPHPAAIPDDCFFNVWDEVRARGGEVQYGWIIWEFPHILLAAEFHAVLVRNGSAVDITPKPDGEDRILFHPDSRRVYERRAVLPIRRPLSLEGNDLMHACRAFEELRERYAVRPTVKGGAEFRVPDRVAVELERLDLRRMEVREHCVQVSRARRSRAP